MELSLRSAPLTDRGEVLSWLARLQAAAVAVLLHGAMIAILLATWSTPSPAPQQNLRTFKTELVRLASSEPAPAPTPKPAPASTPAPSRQIATPPKAVPTPAKTTQRPVTKPIVRPDASFAKPVKEITAMPTPVEAGVAPTTAESAKAEEASKAEPTLNAASPQYGETETSHTSQAYLPLQKTAPDYPAQALRRGIEGNCTVSYTVTTQGQVANPRIVGECHPLFVQPSLQAAREFRYRPRIIGGNAVQVPNIHNTFHYRIESR